MAKPDLALLQPALISSRSGSSEGDASAPRGESCGGRSEPRALIEHQPDHVLIEALFCAHYEPFDVVFLGHGHELFDHAAHLPEDVTFATWPAPGASTPSTITGRATGEWCVVPRWTVTAERQEMSSISADTS